MLAGLGVAKKSLVFSSVLLNFNYYPLLRVFFKEKSLKEIKNLDQKLSVHFVLMYSSILILSTLLH